MDELFTLLCVCAYVLQIRSLAMSVAFTNSHGGPGGGCSANCRRFFDPDTYRIVLFDQRGAGRSKPMGKLEVRGAVVV